MMKFSRGMSVAAITVFGLFVQQASASTLEYVVTSATLDSSTLPAELELDTSGPFNEQFVEYGVVDTDTLPVLGVSLSSDFAGSQVSPSSESSAKAFPGKNYNWAESTQSFDIAELFHLGIDPSGPVAMFMIFTVIAFVGFVVGAVRLEMLRRRAMPIYDLSSRRRSWSSHPDHLSTDHRTLWLNVDLDDSLLSLVPYLRPIHRTRRSSGSSVGHRRRRSTRSPRPQYRVTHPITVEGRLARYPWATSTPT